MATATTAELSAREKETPEAIKGLSSSKRKTPDAIQHLSPSEQKTLEAIHGSFPLRLVPDALKPYAQLSRIHRPAGAIMVYFPCLYGTCLVGCLVPNIAVSQMLDVNARLFLVSVLMRGTLCTWNDVVDRDLDPRVARTRIRPLACRAVSTANAVRWTVAQALLTAASFPLLPRGCLAYLVPLLALLVTYPFAKRWTHHPQLVLGLCVSCGVVVAFPALGQPLWLDWRQAPSANLVSAVSLSAAMALWTLLYDTIYAGQDVVDDAKAGVGSTMLYWGGSARAFLRVLGLLTTASLAAVSFVLKDASPAGGTLYAALSCGGAALGLLCMVEAVDLGDAASCGWCFDRGNVLVGLAIGSGLVGEYLRALYMYAAGE